MTGRWLGRVVVIGVIGRGSARGRDVGVCMATRRIARQPKIKGQFRLLNCNPMIFGLASVMRCRSSPVSRGRSDTGFQRALIGVPSIVAGMAGSHLLKETGLLALSK